MRRVRATAGGKGSTRSLATKLVGRLDTSTRATQIPNAYRRTQRADGVQAKQILFRPDHALDYAKVNIDTPKVVQKAGALVLANYRTSNLYTMGGQPARAAVESSVFPLPIYSFQNYKQFNWCLSGEYGYFDTTTPPPGMCTALGTGNVLHGPKWWQNDYSTEIPPGVGTVVTPGAPFPLGHFLFQTANSPKTHLTIDPEPAHPYYSDGRFASFALGVIKTIAVEGALARTIYVGFYYRYAYTNPTKAFYLDPQPTEHEDRPDTELTYNYSQDPDVTALSATPVVDATLGTTTLWPNSGVGFAHELNAVQAIGFGSTRIFTLDDDGVTLISSDLGDQGKFTLGTKVYQIDFLGWRYFTKENWLKWSDIDVNYVFPGDWPAISGYPTDYDPSFFDPTVIRPTVYLWSDIDSSYPGPKWFLRTANLIDIMVRVVPA